MYDTWDLEEQNVTRDVVTFDTTMCFVTEYLSQCDYKETLDDPRSY